MCMASGPARSQVFRAHAQEEASSARQVVEGRLFSEGLHVLGQPPGPGAMRQYLEAYFDGALPDEALDAVAASDGGAARSADGGLAAVRARLERVFQRVRRLLLQTLDPNPDLSPNCLDAVTIKL